MGLLAIRATSPRRTGRPGFETQAAELFCSGHAWTRDGRLFVAGGWNFQGTNPPGVGSVETWIYDPDLNGYAYGLWIRQTNTLEKARYYPTVIADTRTPAKMFVLGGGATLSSPEQSDYDDYEVFVPGPKSQTSQGAYQTRTAGTITTQLYPGPTFDTPNGLPPLYPSHRLFQYSRTYIVSTGEIVNAGMTTVATRATHNATQATAWSDLSTSAYYRYYGSSVRFPNLTPAHEDTLMIVAGLVCSGGGCVALDSAQWCKATAASAGAWPNGHSWSTLSSLQNARGCLNLVLLPSVAVPPQPGSSFGLVALTDRDYFGSAPRVIGRLRLVRASHPSVRRIGPGCMGTLGHEPQLGMTDRGSQGIRLHFSSGADAGGVLLLGLSSTTWGGMPLPLSLSGLGFSGCNLYGSVEALAPVALSPIGRNGGYGFFDIGWPLRLAGTYPRFQLVGQWLAFGAGALWPGAASEALEWWH